MKLLKEGVKDIKIELVCPICDKPYNTKTGWMFGRGAKLVCPKCSNSSSELTADEIIVVLGKTGLNFKVNNF